MQGRTHFHSQAPPPQAGTRSQGPESGADPRISLSRRRMSLTSGLRRSAAAMSAFLAPAHRHPIPPSRLACFSRLASVLCTTEQCPDPVTPITRRAPSSRRRSSGAGPSETSSRQRVDAGPPDAPVLEVEVEPLALEPTLESSLPVSDAPALVVEENSRQHDSPAM